MKLSQAYDFERLLKQRDELCGARRIADHGDGLGVTIRGTYQDAEMVAAVKAAVVAELNRRIAAIDAQLIAMGIEIDE
ncbi:hypothetical protein [Bradyrhizobium elkanii]|uniref:hypothetical protein n=1 Tax=Bradyrhizobium elkanii TaxID=29448 RepID=UPI00040F8AA5|nr:hypothetical protein [Bradyrhizobium elkanii]